MKLSYLLMCGIAISSCASDAPRLFHAEQKLATVQWSTEDLAKDVAVKTLHRNASSSAHIVRLNKAEFPHFHDHHDLHVTVLKGESVIHFKDSDVPLSVGDIVYIPRGTYHWAENVGESASEVYVVISPPFDGKDRRRTDTEE